MIGEAVMVFLGKARMSGRVNAFEVFDVVVARIGVAMMDVTAVRDRPESTLPNVSMKLFPALREVCVTRPNTVEAAIENLRERVKHDWILEVGCRCSADFHPLSVKNK
jgi:cob(I)alamin adenosyltransferase